MEQPENQYPIQFSVDYPDRPLSRMSSAFRLIAVIPVAIVLALVSGGSGVEEAAGAAGGALFLAPLVMIVFRKKYPRWWFEWNVELLKFENRVGA